MMVIAIGLSSYNLALFHLVNHAFYKALLFLGAGAVIHAVGDNQDFRKYGGLKIGIEHLVMSSKSTNWRESPKAILTKQEWQGILWHR